MERQGQGASTHCQLQRGERKEYMDEYHAYQDKRKEIKALAKEIITNQLNIQ
jgi:hypothetical protein